MIAPVSHTVAEAVVSWAQGGWHGDRQPPHPAASTGTSQNVTLQRNLRSSLKRRFSSGDLGWCLFLTSLRGPRPGQPRGPQRELLCSNEPTPRDCWPAHPTRSSRMGPRGILTLELRFSGLPRFCNEEVLVCDTRSNIYVWFCVRVTLVC